MASQAMIEVWRGGMPESLHRGHAVVADAQGGIVEAWGDPAAVIFPRSSCKMIQALPLIESGAAEAAGLTGRHLALACASHSGAHVHTDLVTEWLAHIGMAEPDLRCGTHWPRNCTARCSSDAVSVCASNPALPTGACSARARMAASSEVFWRARSSCHRPSEAVAAIVMTVATVTTRKRARLIQPPRIDRAWSWARTGPG